MVICIIYNLYTKHDIAFTLSKIFLMFLITTTILGIIAKLLSVSLNKCEDNKNIFIQVICVIKNFIFFIPCLLVILSDKLHKDLKATPSSIYLLFILLIFLICILFGLPIIYDFITNLNKHDLLNGKGPYYLDNKRHLGKYQDFNKEEKTLKYKLFPPGTKYTLLNDNEEQDYNIKAISGYFGNNNNKFEYRYTYSISFQLYINPQPSNTNLAYTKESELFNYGNKPVILYDGKKRKLLIKSKTKTSEGSQMDTIYETKNIKYQKWMLFTINYENNMIDIFIDGELVGSKKNVPPYFDNDRISIGEDNGIQGSIKDIYYYETPRPPNKIKFLYDLSVKSN